MYIVPWVAQGTMYNLTPYTARPAGWALNRYLRSNSREMNGQGITLSHAFVRLTRRFFNSLKRMMSVHPKTLPGWKGSKPQAVMASASDFGVK